MADDATSRALRSLRRDAMRAHRTGDRHLMIAIGMADPDDDEEDGSKSDTPDNKMIRQDRPEGEEWIDSVRKIEPETGNPESATEYDADDDDEEPRRRRGRQ